MIRFIIGVVVFLNFCMPWPASAGVRFNTYSSFDFNPASSGTFSIPFHLDAKADVRIHVYTPDGDAVCCLKSSRPLPPGDHIMKWDGRDDCGTIVPDEAYIPVITASREGAVDSLCDPRQTGGGEVIKPVNISVTPEKHIAYVLPEPARVLIRVGVKNGPMLRSLANWLPKPPGKNIQRWDGYDKDYTIDLRTCRNLSILATAFKLPPNAIITFGNAKMTYRQYRTVKGWPEVAVEPKNMVFERNGRRISRHYYYSRCKDIDPDVVLRFPDFLDRAAGEVLAIKEQLKVQVDMPRGDQWPVQESLYEIAFYIDNAFIAEEEQGYVPMTWLYQVNRLAPGEHILTVNVSGFRGQVGVKSVKFSIVR